jgi:hypothetical protein
VFLGNETIPLADLDAASRPRDLVVSQNEAAEMAPLSTRGSTRKSTAKFRRRLLALVRKATPEVSTEHLAATVVGTGPRRALDVELDLSSNLEKATTLSVRLSLCAVDIVVIAEGNERYAEQ